MGRLRKPSKALVLPEKPSVPETEFQAFNCLIFGAKKIGKTSLCAQFPETFFFMFEPGGKALSLYQPVDKKGKPRVIESWKSFVDYLEAFRSSRFQTGVIDTIDICYELCFNHVCKELGIEHPNDANDFGKSWRAISDEFHRQIRKLVVDRRGLIMLSHEKTREVEMFTGEQYEQLQLSLSGGPGAFVSGIVDFWAYYGYAGEERRLWIRGNANIDAGTRLKYQFRDAITDKPLEWIPMGQTEEEAYANLMRAFRNELTLEKKGAKRRAKVRRSK